MSHKQVFVLFFYLYFYFTGIVVCEAPNNKLDKFTGVLSWKDSKHSLNNENIILRGCILRNTSWCFGMVIFAGTADCPVLVTGEPVLRCAWAACTSPGWMRKVLLFHTRCCFGLAAEGTPTPLGVVGGGGGVPCVRNHWHHELILKGCLGFNCSVGAGYCLVSLSLTSSQSFPSLYILIYLPLKWGKSVKEAPPPPLHSCL